MELSRERLLEVLSYNKATGIFVWRKITSMRAKRVGGTAGGIDKDGYIRIGLDGRIYRAHRLAWFFVTGAWPDADIDHINGDRKDNRFCNLRDVSRGVNIQNKKRALPNNKSGLLGVSFHPHSGLWHAKIEVGGVRYSLKYHKTPEAAHAAYIEAKRRLHEGCTI